MTATAVEDNSVWKVHYSESELLRKIQDILCLPEILFLGLFMGKIFVYAIV